MSINVINRKHAQREIKCMTKMRLRGNPCFFMLLPRNPLKGLQLRQMATVLVEGNIGAGKTSFLNYFKTRYPNQTKIFYEPVDAWTNVGGHNLLELMYKDPKRWSFTFQQFVQLTMFRLHKEAYDYQHNGSNVVKLMERSLFSARHCFTENLFQSKLLSEPEYLILNEWFQEIVKYDCVKADIIIYLRAKPEICYERVKKRARKGEETVTLDYLWDLHNLHKKWLTSSLLHNSGFTGSVITMNAEYSKEEMVNYYEDISSMLSFKKNGVSQEMLMTEVA